MPNVGFQEIVLILIIALLVFGPKKLPEIGKAVGQGLREFRKVSNELASSLNSIGDEVKEPYKEVKNEVEDSVHNVETEDAAYAEHSVYNEEVESSDYGEEAKSKEGDS